MTIRAECPRRLRSLWLSRRFSPSSRHRLGPSQPSYPLQNRPEQSLGHGHFRHLEHYAPGVGDHLRTNLDELLPERRQRPVLYRAREGQRTQELAQIVRQGGRLEPDVGGATGREAPTLPILWRGCVEYVREKIRALQPFYSLLDGTIEDSPMKNHYAKVADVPGS